MSTLPELKAALATRWPNLFTTTFTIVSQEQGWYSTKGVALSRTGRSRLTHFLEAEWIWWPMGDLYNLDRVKLLCEYMGETQGPSRELISPSSPQDSNHMTAFSITSFSTFGIWWTSVSSHLPCFKDAWDSSFFLRWVTSSLSCLMASLEWRDSWNRHKVCFLARD